MDCWLKDFITKFIVRDEPEWIQAKMILGWIIEVGLMGETF